MSTGKTGSSSCSSAAAAAAAITHSADTSSASSDRVEWSRSTILGFIEDYRRQRVLWDPNTKGYHIKQTKYEALKSLGSKYGTEIRSIRSKIKSLRSSFHREHGKVINGRRKGVHYQPMWFAYEAIRFILDGESSSTASSSAALRRSPESGAEEAATATPTTTTTTMTEEKLAPVEGGDSTAAGADDDGDELEEDDYLLATREQQQQQQQLCDNALKVETAEELRNATPATTTTRTSATTTTTTTMLMRATSTNACADDNNIVARIAAAAAAAVAASGRSADELAVSRSDYDGDSQNYCNISADDVKTELIESDSADLAMMDRQLTSTPSPLNYCKHADRTSNRKRKFHSQMESRHNDDSPSPSKQQQQQQHSNSLSQPLDTSSGTAVASTSSFANSKTATNQADEYGVFGEYVAITIRKLKTSKSKIVVKHLINNLLYEAELGKYDHGIPSSKEPPQLYKM